MGDDSKLNFKFEISLQRLCLIRIATSLWERGDTRQKIRLFFLNVSPEDDDFLLIRNWQCDLTSRVLPLINNLLLPSILNNTLKHFISSIGSQIFQWTKFLTKTLEFEINCNEDIFWTHYGTIDKVRIFKYWFDHKKLESPKLFNVACIFCLEEYVPILWNEIPEEVKKNDLYSRDIYTYSIYNMIIYWKKRLGEEIKEDFVSSIHVEEWEVILALRRAGVLKRDKIYHKKVAWLELCHDGLSIEENMYRGATIEGLELAVQFFWNLLNENQQEIDFEDIIQTIDGRRNERGYSEILLFMMSKLKIEKTLPFLYSFSFWETLLRTFPYEEFFIPTLNRALELNSRFGILGNNFFWFLIGSILNRIDDEDLLYDSGGDSIYEKILNEMWEMIPEDARIWVAENPSLYIQRGLQRRGLC